MSATATEVTHFLFEAKPLWTGAIGAAGVSDETVQTIPLQVATNLDNGDAYVFTINRVDVNGTKTTNPTANTEVCIGKLNGTNFINCVRGQEGTAQQWDAGTVVEILFTATHWNKMIEFLGVEHNADGTHTESSLDSMIEGTEAQGDIIYHNGTIWTRLPKGTDGQVLTQASDVPSWADIEAGASFWNDLPAAATRVSDTQFTLTDTGNAGKYDLLFKKGVILKWMESTTFQTAMVISSSYSTDVVTINIVGDSLTAGFTDLKYAMVMAKCEEFLCPGNQGVDTDVSKAWFAPEDIYKLSVDVYVSTAGTTNATTFDLNDDGSTVITTKPSIASGATSDLDNVCDAPSTPIAKDSKMTVDRDAASTTNAIDGFLRFWYYPASWRYR